VLRALNYRYQPLMGKDTHDRRHQHFDPGKTCQVFFWLN